MIRASLDAALQRRLVTTPLVLVGLLATRDGPQLTPRAAGSRAIPIAAHRSPAPMTADGVIARFAEARGGLEKIRAVKSQRLTGQITFSGGGGGPIVVEQRQPNKIREEVTIQGKLIIHAYNGTSGWTVDPFGTPPGFRVLSGDDLNNLAAEADYDPLLNYRATGDRVELTGRDTAAGAPAYKLQVTLPSGYVDYYYIDSATALPTKWQGHRIVNGKAVVFESYFREYQTAEGLKFPRLIQTGAQGMAGHQELTFDHVELNPPVGDDRFTAPPSPH